MKYFFGIHKEDDDNVFNKYLIRQISEETEKQTEENISDQQEVIKKKSFPSWLIYLSYFVLSIGLIIILSFFKGDGTFSEKISNNMVLFIVGICLAVVGGIVLLMGSLINKHFVEKDEDYKRSNEKLEERVNIHRYELNIPQEAKDIDFLFMIVKEKNGQEKQNVWKAVANYNFELSVFVENGLLCFCDRYAVYGVPLEAFKKIVPIKGRRIFTPWNKEDNYKSDKYKEYKIKINNQGFACKCYGIMLDLDEEEYQIIIPNYELEEFRKIIDLPLVEEEK